MRRFSGPRMTRRFSLGPICTLLVVCALAAFTPRALAAQKPTSASLGTPAVRVQPNEIRITGLGDNSAIQIAILLTFLNLIPALVMCLTPFARLFVVVHF